MQFAEDGNEICVTKDFKHTILVQFKILSFNESKNNRTDKGPPPQKKKKKKLNNKKKNKKKKNSYNFFPLLNKHF